MLLWTGFQQVGTIPMPNGGKPGKIAGRFVEAGASDVPFATGANAAAGITDDFC